MANITGTNGDDTLPGTEGADTISGLGGNDLIGGFGGNDTILAGSGDDQVIGGTGNDSIFGDADDDLLLGETGADLVDGGDGADIVADNDIFLDGSIAIPIADSSADNLRGGAGDDFLTGGQRDVFDGGSGIDIALITFASLSSVSIDLSPLNTGGTAALPFSGSIRNVEGGISITFGGGSNTATGSDFVEEFFGGSGAETFDGGGGDDTLIGAGGDDNIRGGAGADFLTGDAGNDTLNGGSGADIMDGGAGADTASYAAAGAAIVADLVSPATNAGDAAGDAYASIEHLAGSSFDDPPAPSPASVRTGASSADTCPATGGARAGPCAVLPRENPGKIHGSGAVAASLSGANAVSVGA